MTNMKCPKMTRNQKTYIVIVIFTLFSSYAISGDILDGYISRIMAKSNAGEDKLLKILDESKSRTGSSSKKGDNKVAEPVNDGVSVDDEPVKAASSMDGVKAEDSSSRKQATDIEKASFATLNKTRNLREKLKDSSIKSLPDGGSSKINSKLQDVLAQLRSLSLPEEGIAENQDTNPLPKPKEVVTKPEIKSEVAETVESVSLPEEKQPAVLLPEDTSEIVNMFELAESLFHIGDKANALKYYRKALEKSFPVGKDLNPKRAWILFQIGNCLYNVDNLEAVKIFEQLLLEHPNSDWANCARTKKQVLKWLIVEKPMTHTMTEVK